MVEQENTLILYMCRPNHRQINPHHKDHVSAQDLSL